MVDDSPEVDHEIFETREFDSKEWVLIAEDTPLDEHRRDELVEQFQLTHSPGGDLLAEDLDPTWTATKRRTTTSSTAWTTSRSSTGGEDSAAGRGAQQAEVLQRGRQRGGAG